MGFLGDLESGLAMTSPATYLLKDSIDRQNMQHAKEFTDPRNTFTNRSPNGAGVAGLVNPIYGLGTNGEKSGALDYSNVFNQGYQNLGQTYNDPNPDHNRNEVYVAGTRSLASSFADSVLKKTGQLPTEDQVRQFVAQNLTPGFAQKFITGMPPDQIDAISNSYIDTNPDVLASFNAQQAQTAAQAQQAQNQSAMKSYTDSLQGYANQQYDTGAQALQNSTQDAYVPAKRGLVEDLAAQNSLGNANSRYSLDTLEGTKNRTLSEGLTNLAGQRAQTMSGLGAQGAQLGLQSQQIGNQSQSIANQAKQYGQSLGLANREFMNNQDVQNQNFGLMSRQLDTATKLGKQQADANKPGAMDWLNTGIKGLTAIGGFATGNPFMAASGTAGLLSDANKYTQKSQYGGNSAFA